MRRGLVLTGWFLGAFLLETSLFPFLFQRIAQPSLILIMVIFFGLWFGEREGATLGFLYGFSTDLVGGRYPGTETLAQFLTGYLVGISGQRLVKEHLLTALFAVFAASLFHDLVLLLIRIFLGLPLAKVGVILSSLFFTALINTLCGLPLFPLFKRAATKGILRG